MNRNEFENWMKDKMQEQPFSPGEDMWQKLHADLQKPASGKRKALIFLPWMKIAASVTLILSLSVATMYFVKKGPSKEGSVAISKKAPESSSIQTDTDTQQPTLTAAAQTHVNKAGTVTQHNKNKTEQKDKSVIVPKGEVIIPQIARTDKKETDNITQSPPARQKESLKDNPGIPPQRDQPNELFYADNRPSQQVVNLGMAANVGRSNISNIGYQVGVVGRANISRQVFVEAGISVASNTVSNSSTHSFSGVELGTSFDGLSNTKSETVNKVQANYARNIISVGVTPSVGIKVTPRLSVSTGGSVYRNLNPSLELTNGNTIESTALTNDIISTSQQVTTWDVGLTCNADYKVTKNLSFNVNYRKGLTDYLQQENKYIKNSGVQLGIKFLFGK